MTDEQKRHAVAFANLAHNADFLYLFEWLKAHSNWGQGPLDAAGFEALRGAYIEGRQSIIKLTEIEIEAAKVALNHE